MHKHSWKAETKNTIKPHLRPQKNEQMHGGKQLTFATASKQNMQKYWVWINRTIVVFFVCVFVMKKIIVAVTVGATAVDFFLFTIIHQSR